MKNKIDAQKAKEFWSSSKSYPLVWEPEEQSRRELYIKERADVIKLTAPKGKTVLDVGTGKGRFAIAFALSGAKWVTGLDLSQEMLNIGAERAEAVGHKDITFELGDAENLRYQDESFDIVCCMQTFEFLPNPEEALREFVRVCKRGGVLVVSAANSECRPLLARIKGLIERNTTVYKVVTAIYFSRPLYPLRLKLCHVLPVVRTRTSKIVLRRGDTKEEFQRFFQGAGLQIERMLEYGEPVPEHFICFGRKQ